MEGCQTYWQGEPHPVSAEKAQEAVFGFADGGQLNRFSFGNKHHTLQARSSVPPQDVDDSFKLEAARSSSPFLVSNALHQPRQHAENALLEGPSRSTSEFQPLHRAMRSRSRSLLSMLRGSKKAEMELSAAEDSHIAEQPSLRGPHTATKSNRIRMKSLSHIQDMGRIRVEEHGRIWKWTRGLSTPNPLSLEGARSQHREDLADPEGASSSKSPTTWPESEGGTLLAVKVLGMSMDASSNPMRSEAGGVVTRNSSQTSFSSLIQPNPPAPLPPPRQLRRHSERVQAEPRQRASSAQDLPLAADLDRSEERSAALHGPQMPAFKAAYRSSSLASIVSPLSPMTEETASTLSGDVETPHAQLSPHLPYRNDDGFARRWTFLPHRAKPVMPAWNSGASNDRSTVYRPSSSGTNSFINADEDTSDQKVEQPIHDDTASLPALETQHLSLMPMGMVTAAISPTQWTHSNHDRDALREDHHRVEQFRLGTERLFPSQRSHDLGAPDGFEEAPFADRGVQASLAALRALESPGESARTILARQRILGTPGAPSGETLSQMRSHMSEPSPDMEDEEHVADRKLGKSDQLQQVYHDACLQELRELREKVLQLESSLDLGRDLTRDVDHDRSKMLGNQSYGLDEAVRRVSKSSSSTRRKPRPTKQGYSTPDILIWQAELLGGNDGTRTEANIPAG